MEYWTRLNSLKHLNISYYSENKNSTIVLSAPHSTSQIRNGKYKPKDLGSGELVLKLAEENNLSYIVKTKNRGLIENIDDDANFQENCDYRTQLISLCKLNSVLFDIHSLKINRKEDINISINSGELIFYNSQLLNKIKLVFKKYNLILSIDFPFKSQTNTIAKNMHSKLNIYALQVEINSKLINPKSEENKIEDLSSAFKEIFTYINKNTNQLERNKKDKFNVL